ncbi:MAG: alpha/beta fold hydrolase [Candidatus Baltobacteraceae bacterium]
MKVLLAIALAAAAIAAASPESQRAFPDGTYRYEMRLGGRPIGSSTMVVSRSGGILTVGESASLAGAALVTQRTIEEPAFSTISYRTNAGGPVVVTVLGNEARLTHGESSTKISAAPSAPFFVSDNMAAGFAQIPATLHATGEQQLTMACVCGTFLALPVHVLAGQDAARPAGVPARDAVVAVSMEGATATLWYDPQTYVLDRLDLPSQAFAIVLQSYDSAIVPLPQPVVPTPVPLPAPRYAARDVSIVAGDGVTLAGTLTMPAAAATPLPGFVFVHGSGCIDRDESVGPNKIFAQLANRLSNDGYAVLRYDKRSCGKSGGTFPTRDRLIADALDAVAYLRSQPGIDPTRIFALGHSEGGELVPSVAIADKKLRGIVLLAPPALPLERILMQQALRNATPADRATIARQEQAQIDAIAQGKKSGAGAAWLRSSFGIDPASLIARVPPPILIVQGGKDIQVLEADMPHLVQAARSANRRVTVVVLPNDDHLFITLPPGVASTGAEYFVPSYLDPALFAAIESWLATAGRI